MPPAKHDFVSHRFLLKGADPLSPLTLEIIDVCARRGWIAEGGGEKETENQCKPGRLTTFSASHPAASLYPRRERQKFPLPRQRHRHISRIQPIASIFPLRRQLNMIHLLFSVGCGSSGKDNSHTFRAHRAGRGFAIEARAQLGLCSGEITMFVAFAFAPPQQFDLRLFRAALTCRQPPLPASSAGAARNSSRGKS